MSENTKIEWCDHTVNHWRGCAKVSAGCANCYAEGLDARFNGGGHWGKGAPRKQRIEAARKEALALNRKAAKLGVRYRVFGNSMNDWLDPEVPIEWLANLLDVIRRTPHLDWLLLTKRPELWRERMSGAAGHWGYEGQVGHFGANDSWALCFDWLHYRPPHNVWIGTSVENQDAADERIPHLLQIPARVRFLSCEPLLGPLTLPVEWDEPEDGGSACIDGIHWVICGGESGPNARPMHPDWARSLRDQCVAAGVPFFFKQWGEWRHSTNNDAWHWALDRQRAGTLKPTDYIREEDSYGFARVGKKAAGRTLDGREWSQFPEVQP